MGHSESLKLDEVLLDLVLVSRLLVGLVKPRSEREIFLVDLVLCKKPIVCLSFHQLVKVLLCGMWVFTVFDLLGLTTFNTFDHHLGALAVHEAKMRDGFHSGQFWLTIFLLSGK